MRRRNYLITANTMVSIRARHECRAMHRKDVHVGRRLSRFNPRPARVPGDAYARTFDRLIAHDVSIRARHECRAMHCTFIVTATILRVSIRARHECRAMPDGRSPCESA